MKSPLLNWACGSVAVLGLPLGVLVALSLGSIMAGLVNMLTVVCVVMVACRKDILREYRHRKTPLLK